MAVDDALWFGVSRKGHKLAYTKGGERNIIWKCSMPEREGQVAPAQKLITSNQSQWLGRFSPDGQKIAFTSFLSGKSNVWICDSDGSNPIQPLDFGEFQSGAPCWSPDNLQIAFDSDQYGQRDIFIMDANGGHVRRMTTDAAEDQIPSWSRDGRWIYFTSNRRRKPEIWKVPAAGGDAVLVWPEEGWGNIESPDGQWLYFSAWGKVWRLSLENRRKELVVDGNWSFTWFPVADGIYYTKESADKNGSILYFHDYKSNSIKTVAILQQKEIRCLDFSPDRKTFLVHHGEISDYDIYVVENYR